MQGSYSFADQYIVQANLYHGKKFSVYRAQKSDSAASYIVKQFEKRTAQDTRYSQALHKEFRFLQELASPYVISVIDWIDGQDAAMLVLEDIQGRTLKEALRQRQFSTAECLELAGKIVEGLAAIHRQQMIHKDLNPTNIIWNAETGQVQVIDFDIAVKYDMKIAQAGNPDHLEGTLPYIAPEQTGRMNCTVDQRSDLYSLGVTLYELLTGKLPFESPDPLELVYAHLARSPEPPHEMNTQIPECLSQLVLKLLSKNSAERYQSAEGVLYDLKQIQQAALTGFQTLSGFPLGTQDISGKLHIPEKLYGREAEIEQLLEAYQRVRQGEKELILVSGYAGSGKTALVHAIYPAITRDRGYFISGKFEQLQRTIPYFAFIQAFQQFCDLLLMEKQDALAQWKARLLEAVGGLGKILTEMIPRLDLIIGVQPEIPEAGDEETRQRFHYVLRRFLQVIASQEHPLVLFLDDLQWADLASLHLLQDLVEDTQSRHALFIGAYRENEVSAAHPLMTILREMQQHERSLLTISVPDLAYQHIREWVADTLRLKDASARQGVDPLSTLIYEKTRGNAFFTIQFLKNLYQRNLLRFDTARRTWSYDLAQIERENITENVVDLLSRRIRTLPEQTQTILSRAACVGNIFDLRLLAILAEQEASDLEEVLETALSEQFIAPVAAGRYKFAHDRIHQAAYALIPEQERKPLHLKMGRVLLKMYDAAESSEFPEAAERHIFDLVHHLNIGSDLLETEAELLQLAILNLKAGQQAKLSAAYLLAAGYIQTAMRLLPQKSWQQHYDLTLSVYNEAIQTSYLSGNYEDMEHTVEIVLNAARTIEQAAAAYEYRMLRFLAQGRPDVAVETLLTTLETLGVPISTSGRSVRRQNIESLQDLSMMHDPEKQLAIRLFYVGAMAVMFGAPQLMPSVVSKMLALTLKRGLTPETPFLLSLYGIIRLLGGDIAGAYRAGEIATSLLGNQTSNEGIKVRAFSMISFYLLGNKQHYKQVCARMLDTLPLALNIGDFEYASYIISTYIHFLSRTDTELALWKEQFNFLHEQLIQIKQSLVLIPINLEVDYHAALTGAKEYLAVLATDVDQLLQLVPESLSEVFRFSANLKKTLLGCIFAEFTYIRAYLQVVEENWNAINIPIPYYTSDFHFYRPLAYIQISVSTTEPDERERSLQKVQESLSFLRKWAKFGPVNVLHKYYLLQAELYRVTGKPRQAAEFYDKAVETALKNDYVNEAALASELAAKFYLEQKREQWAEFYLLKARQYYQQWGAAAKVKHLDEHYPKYLRRGVSTLSQDGTSRGTDSTSSLALDVHTLLKASQTLSGEVQLSGLFEKMLRILIENAGARRGVFLEARGEHLLVQADGRADGVKKLLQAIPVEETGNVPLAVINYVARSKQPLVFDHLAKETAYAHDPYIQQRQPVSAVCFPVLKQGELAAILYLENDLVEGAFTPARLEILNLLSAQIAISVENAELYENLEEKVRQRTAELRQAHADLEHTHEALAESHKAITDSVDYASRIQEAVLPAEDVLAELLPEHFILFQPRSVVSGDFYWARQVEERLIVAAVDCTGHGVPGALVSMLGMAFLNELVPQLAAQGRLQAGTLLDELREKVKTAFKQEGRLMEQKDGLDIALCIFEPDRARLQFAGAYNPLYLIRNGELLEIKADRMPIGIHRREQPFSAQDVDLQAGDRLYLFSDGYKDQDGGPHRTGFSKARFQELLLEIHQEPLERQKDVLLQRFTAWKGDFPQRDDVLVFGLRM